MFFRQNNPAAPTINYIWVGLPPDKTNGEPGHDISGPIAMAKCNKTNPIIFWCLREQEKTYRNLLKNHPLIQVHGIESYLEEKFSDNSTQQAASEAKNIINELLKIQRNTARDKVSVKEMFSLFLLFTKGGYVLDTNVIPENSKAIALPSYESFRVPALNDFPKQPWDFDLWIMYSPPKNKTAENVFQFYLQKWPEAQEQYKREQYSQKYYGSLERIITNIFAFSLRDMLTYWSACVVPKSGKSIFSIDELNLRKYYFNTHRHELRSEYDQYALHTEKTLNITGFFFPGNVATILSEYVPELLEPKEKKGSKYTQIYFDILSENLEGLNTRIAGGVNVNQQMTCRKGIGETPLHFAITYNRLECIKILLENDADPMLEVKYKNFPPMDAYSLARLHSKWNDPAINEILENYKACSIQNSVHSRKI